MRIQALPATIFIDIEQPNRVAKEHQKQVFDNGQFQHNSTIAYTHSGGIICFIGSFAATSYCDFEHFQVMSSSAAGVASMPVVGSQAIHRDRRDSAHHRSRHRRLSDHAAHTLSSGRYQCSRGAAGNA